MRKSKILWLYGELPGLIQAGVLSPEAAENLRAHYGPARKTPLSQVALIFCGILGAALVGSGIILLFAHNWESLSRTTRTVLSFTPLLAGQALAGWTLLRHADSQAWRESSAVFLAAAIGACIALIGQTYHISGDMPAFLLTWLLLGLPLVYLLRSLTGALLYLVGIVSWAGYTQEQGGQAVFFWLLFAALLPFAWNTWKENRKGPRILLLAWAACLCMIVALGIVLEKNMPGIWIPAYSALFFVMYLLGQAFFKETSWQPFTAIACAGLTILSLLFTYPWPWKDIGYQHYRTAYRFHELASVQDYVLVLLFYTLAVGFAVRQMKTRNTGVIAWALTPALAVLCYAGVSMGMSELVATGLFNACLLILGIVTLRNGVLAGRLAVANGGLAMLCLLFVARFFDSELSFVFRGVAFIIAGIAFLGVNVILARHFRGEEESMP